VDDPASLSSVEAEQRLREQVDRILALVRDGCESFHDLEQALLPLVFALGRLALVLFLSHQDERLDVPAHVRRARSFYVRREAKSRLLGTFFGKIRTWRRSMCIASENGDTLRWTWRCGSLKAAST